MVGKFSVSIRTGIWDQDLGPLDQQVCAYKPTELPRFISRDSKTLQRFWSGQVLSHHMYPL